MEGFIQGYLRCLLSLGIQLDPNNSKTVCLITVPSCHQLSKLGMFLSLPVWYFNRLPTDLPNSMVQRWPLAMLSHCCFQEITSLSHFMTDFVWQQWKMNYRVKFNDFTVAIAYCYGWCLSGRNIQKHSTWFFSLSDTRTNGIIIPVAFFSTLKSPSLAVCKCFFYEIIWKQAQCCNKISVFKSIALMGKL